MKLALFTCAILTFGAMPVLAMQQAPPMRPPVIQPGDTIRIYTSTCPLNNNRSTANQRLVLQSPVDYSPCINWTTNRVILELTRTKNYDKVITQRIERLQELGGTDVVKQFLDTKGRDFIATLQQQSPEVYQQYSDDLKQLFSNYQLQLQ